MYELYGTAALPSTRYRDLVDLVFIALREGLNGAHACAALRREVDRRADQRSMLAVPTRFEVPAGNWVAGYRGAAAEVAGLASYRTLEQASILAHAFLDPVLDGRARSMTWEPTRLAWVDDAVWAAR